MNRGHPNLGYKIRYKEGYFPVPAGRLSGDIRTEMMLHESNAASRSKRQHHEVATGGQAKST